MRLHRFYINEKVGGRGEITLADSELIHQMVNVFRFGNHDKVILFDGSGFEFECEIILINKKEVSLKILNTIQKDLKQKKVSLYLSLIKKSNFELAAEKCTEVGVSEIHPIISERSEKKDLNIERLNKIVKEASEQSGRVNLPKVFNVADLEEAVTQAVSEGKVCVTFHTTTDSSIYSELTQANSLHLRQTNHSESCLSKFEGEVAAFQTTSASEAHSSLEKEEISGCHQVATFIGPEGGWSDDEIELFKKNNFKILSLGSNILRAETAAIVAVWSVLNN
jgi:16S rRNA (uracil1498-N3)-methyltransferase